MKNPTPFACEFCFFWLHLKGTAGVCRLPGNAKAETRESIGGDAPHRMSDAGYLTDAKTWCPAFRQRQIEDTWYPPEDV